MLLTQGDSCWCWAGGWKDNQCFFGVSNWWFLRSGYFLGMVMMIRSMWMCFMS